MQTFSFPDCQPAPEPAVPKASSTQKYVRRSSPLTLLLTARSAKAECDGLILTPISGICPVPARVVGCRDAGPHVVRNAQAIYDRAGTAESYTRQALARQYCRAGLELDTLPLEIEPEVYRTQRRS